MQMFNLISLQNLTPNSFYLLYCLRESVQTPNINLHLELKNLVDGKFIVSLPSPKTFSITTKGEELISEVESYFKVQKKKTTVAIMGTDFTENLIKYNELFPKLKLPSGKLARAAVKNLETNFRWFFENHDYPWNIIFKATALYVDEYGNKGWKFMRTSMYFIKKQESDKSITSDLADYCEMIITGGEIEPINYFTDKVT